MELELESISYFVHGGYRLTNRNMLFAQPHWPDVLAYTSRIRLSNFPSLAVCIRVVGRCDLCCDGMDGPYRLPYGTATSALAWAAKLRAASSSSCCYYYLLKVDNRPS